MCLSACVCPNVSVSLYICVCVCVCVKHVRRNSLTWRWNTAVFQAGTAAQNMFVSSLICRPTLKPTSGRLKSWWAFLVRYHCVVLLQLHITNALLLLLLRVGVCVRGYVCSIKWKPLILMTWNLACSSPQQCGQTLLILGSKGQGSGLSALLPVDQNLCQNAAGVTEYNCLWKIHPHFHNALSDEYAKWYLWHFVQWTWLALSVTSSRATLSFKLTWICGSTECTLQCDFSSF